MSAFSIQAQAAGIFVGATALFGDGFWHGIFLSGSELYGPAKLVSSRSTTEPKEATGFISVSIFVSTTAASGATAGCGGSGGSGTSACIGRGVVCLINVTLNRPSVPGGLVPQQIAAGAIGVK